MKANLCKHFTLLAIAIISLFINSCKKDNKPAETPPAVTSPVLPVADFNFTMANNQVLPCAVTFTNASKNAQTYQWYFDDNGANSTVQSPTYTYGVSKTYNVKLVASNAAGKDSITKQVTFASTLITGISISEALPNTIVAIKGIGFGAGIANNSVAFNGVPATINSATATEIDVTVPANATSGNLTLTTNGATIIYPGFTVDYPVLSTFTTFPLNHLGGSISFGGGYVMVGDRGRDSVFFALYTYVNAVATGVRSTSGFYNQVVPAQTQLWGLAVDANENTYTVGSNDYNIYKIDHTYNSTGTLFAGSGVSGYADGQGTAAQFTAPRGMAIDVAGNLYINDAHRIRKITPTGLVSTLAGSGADGNTDGQGTAATFGNLYGIAADATGNVYVTDDEYLNIRKITPTGVVTTLAGSGAAGFADGAGKAAQFYYPKGITADQFGNVFVSDSNYNNTSPPYTSCIRMINSAGMVATLLNSNKGDNVSNPDGIYYAISRSYNSGLYYCNTGPGAANQNVIQAFLVAK